MKVRVALLLSALVVAGTADAATPGWTTRDARAAARALGYPKPHARKTACRAVTGGFRCRSQYRRGHKVFFLFPTGNGWVIAGPHRTGARMLKEGFVPVDAVDPHGGLAQDASSAADGYIQQHYNGQTPQGGGCTATGNLGYTCTFSSPAVTVTITYKKVKGGWTIRGATS